MNLVFQNLCDDPFPSKSYLGIGHFRIYVKFRVRGFGLSILLALRQPLKILE